MGVRVELALGDRPGEAMVIGSISEAGTGNNYNTVDRSKAGIGNLRMSGLTGKALVGTAQVAHTEAFADELELTLLEGGVEQLVRGVRSCPVVLNTFGEEVVHVLRAVLVGTGAGLCCYKIHLRQTERLSHIDEVVGIIGTQSHITRELAELVSDIVLALNLESLVNREEDTETAVAVARLARK